MASQKRHSIVQNITASGGAFLSNIGGSVNPIVLAFLDVIGTVTGTTPSMTVNIYSSVDGVRKTTTPVASFSAVTAQSAGPARLLLQNMYAPFVYVEWVVTGTSPVFNNVNIDLFFSGTDGS